MHRRITAILTAAALGLAAAGTLPVSGADTWQNADAVQLQGYLLSAAELPADGWQSYDLDGSGSLDARDLTLLKRRICAQNAPVSPEGMPYDDALAAGLIYRYEYDRQITGTLKADIEAALGRELDFACDRFYGCTGMAAVYHAGSGKVIPVWEETPRRRAVWYWRGRAADFAIETDPAVTEEFLDALQWYGITDIYYSIGANKLVSAAAQTADFVTRARSRDMRVYLLAGENTWAFEDSYAVSVDRIFDRVAEYNRLTAPEAHLAGVSYDAEVWTNKAWDWKNDPAVRLAQVEQIRYAQARADAENLAVNFCLAFWLVRYDFPDTDGSTANVYDAITRCARETIIMAYRDTPAAVERLVTEQQQGAGASLLAYNRQNGCALQIGVQADENKEGDFVSFYEEESLAPGTVTAALAQIEADIPDPDGITDYALHHAVQLYEFYLQSKTK